MSGGLGKGNEDVLQLGIDVLQSIAPEPISLEECMMQAFHLTEAAVVRLCKLISAGVKMN